MATIASAGEPRPLISPLQERIDWLGQACELSLAQQYVLSLLARIARVPQVRNLVGAINEDDYDSDQFDFSELRPILDARFKRGDLSENGLLSRFGLIEIDTNHDVRITIRPGRRGDPRLAPADIVDIMTEHPAHDWGRPYYPGVE
jgi:hypothetical protein